MLSPPSSFSWSPRREPSGRRWGRVVALALVLTGLALPGTAARGSSFDLYGFSARARGMGSAQVALGINYDAAYYNPANILSRKQTHFGMGLDLVVPALDFDAVEGQFSPLMPDTSAGFHLGGSTPISGAFQDLLGFGIALFHPLTSGTKIESIDPATPYFYRYQNLPDKLVLALALAGEPAPWLRIGVGMQVLATFDGEVEASMSLAEGRFTRESIDVQIVPSVSPTLGLAFGPFEGLRFGATWRHELELDYQLPVKATIEGIGDLDVYVHGVSLYTPSQLALGLGWESAPAPEPGVSVEAGLTWELWSAAPPAGADFVLSVDDSEVRPPTDPQDAPEALIDVRSEGAPVGARDTVTPRIGVEWRPDTTWTARAGWFWRPTPLPTPVYQTNLLDATAHVFSLGAGVTFGDPIGVSPAPLSLDLTLQLTRLDQRAVRKDPAGRPTGAYTFGGLIWHVGLDLRHDYY